PAANAGQLVEVLTQLVLGGRNDAVRRTADGYPIAFERNAHHAAAHDQPSDGASISAASRDQVCDGGAEAHLEIARCRNAVAGHRRHTACHRLAGLEISKERRGGADVLTEVANVGGFRERRHLVPGQRLDELTLTAG